MLDSAIITCGVALPHGMDGYDTTKKTFIRWASGSSQPMSFLPKPPPTHVFVCGKHLTWNSSGYYEMSVKNSAAYRVKNNLKRRRSGLTEADGARPSIKHVSFQSNHECNHFLSKIVTFMKGTCVCISDGAYRGETGIVQGHVSENPSYYIVLLDERKGSEESRRKVQVSYLHLSISNPAAELSKVMPRDRVIPGDVPLNEVSDSSIVYKAPKNPRHTYKPDQAPHRPQLSTIPSVRAAHFTKGSVVCVVEGAYQGCRGTVQGVGRAGRKILSGQYRVFVEYLGGILVLLPAHFLQPWSASRMAHPPSPSLASPALQHPVSSFVPVVDLNSCTVAEDKPPAPLHEGWQLQQGYTPELEPMEMEPELLEEDFQGVVEMLQSDHDSYVENNQGNEGNDAAPALVYCDLRNTAVTITGTAPATVSSLASNEFALVQPVPVSETSQCGDMQALAQISAIYADAGDLTALTGLLMFK